MRTRQEIENQIRSDNHDRQPQALEADVLLRILEVALDIREWLVSQERPKP